MRCRQYRGNFIAINAYILKKRRSHFNNLTFNLKILEMREYTKPKVSRRKETLQIITVGVESLKEWRTSMKPKKLAL